MLSPAADVLRRIQKHNWRKWDAAHSHHGWVGHEDPAGKRAPAAQAEPANRAHSASTIGMGSAAAARVKEVEKSIAHNATESGHAIDPNTGEVLWSKGGTDRQVEITDADQAKMIGKDLIFTHNHPSGLSRPDGISTSLSLEDVRTAAALGFKQIRAVSPGAVFVMYAPPGGFKPEGDRLLVAAYNRAHGELNAEVMGHVEGIIQKTGATSLNDPAIKVFLDKKNHELQHDHWTRVAELANSHPVFKDLQGLTYRRFLTGDNPL